MENKDKNVEADKDLVRIRHQLIDTIDSRLKSFSLNTVISGFMEFNNKLCKLGEVDKETLSVYVQLLAPFAPHIAEELWQQLGHENSVFEAGWPVADKEAMKEDTKEIAVQVNGKTRATIQISLSASKEEVIAQAKESVSSRLSGDIVKEIYVPGKIVNIVCKG